MTRRPRGRAEHAILAALALAALLAWWMTPSAPAAPPPDPAAAPVFSAAAAPAPLPPGAVPATAAPTPAQREAQRALWQERLERAQQVLEAYRRTARYPPESRPAAEHADRLHPFRPVTEDRPLRLPGGSVTEGVRLRTSQERIFLAGQESSRVTVALVDAEGRVLPLRAARSVLHEVVEPGRTARAPELSLPMNPGPDGVLSAVIHPAAQGFGEVAGTLRLDLLLEYAGQPGTLYFDVVYSPEQAAQWLPGVAEAVVDGDLRFTLRAQVALPGRYVVSARVDDAAGRPVALALFNAELGAGVQAIPLPVAGRLLHDLKPAFPLALRDVEAFLLKPDTFPDRVMLPRLAGVLHRSRAYGLERFADAEPQNEQRTRYLAELEKDVREAQDALEALKGPGP